MIDPSKAAGSGASPPQAGALSAWIAVTAIIGSALIVTTLLPTIAAGLTDSQRAALPQMTALGALLVGAAVTVFAMRRRVAAFLEPGRAAQRVKRHPYTTLFLISFASLFLEVLLIRYCGSQIRVFAFYKNVPLIACFLGLGVGACRAHGSARHAASFLLWLVPLTAALSQGALLLDGYLSSWAARGSSEQILGDLVRPASGDDLLSQIAMGAFCVLALLAIALLFTLLGRLLGQAFEGLERLPAYTVNILGSLAGILGFVAVSALWTPPWVWLAIGLLPLLWWLPGHRRMLGAAALGLVSVALVAPSFDDTVWSPYQKLIGRSIEAPAAPDASTPTASAYAVRISDVFYQIAVDLRPEAWAAQGRNPFPHYDAAYARFMTPPERVLIVGAGTGNDVAAALRAGAQQVDAVDIDPAIVEMGRQHHPEDPYGDPRTRVIVQDARRAFHALPAASYDAVVFGLLDSHTQLGISSVRLDNYVFTRESFAAAARLLRPGGRLVVTAATFRDWFQDRITRLLETACGSPAEVTANSVWLTYSCVPAPDRPGAPGPHSAEDASGDLAAAPLPTDDWPFVYLPERSVPRAYLVVLALLAMASLLALRLGGVELGTFDAAHLHFFFLGAAFLLMEVYAINRLALLFGATWLVSAVTIALVLTLIVLGNLTVTRWGTIPDGLSYGALVVSLMVSYGLDPDLVLGKGLVWMLAYGLVALSPVYFAALVFARSFRTATHASSAIGVNILGAVVGGWTEYATMATGIRSMVLFALIFYLSSWLTLRHARRGTWAGA